MFARTSLFISLFFISCMGFAVENLDCRIEFTFTLSETSRYSYTGYGDMHCSDNLKPFTVFSAINIKNFNPEANNLSSFQLNINNFKIETLSYIFQKYTLNTNRFIPTLYFKGNGPFPPRILKGSFKEVSQQQISADFIKSMMASDLVIDQDDFFSFLSE